MTHEELLLNYHYDENTGIFTLAKQRSRIKSNIGDVMGTKNNDGYLVMAFEGGYYLLHRLAWFYMYGTMPNIIDHKDHDKTNNRIRNLRNTTREGNSRNLKIPKNNKSGTVGVRFNKAMQKWTAEIWVSGKSRYLGSFIKKQDAVSTRLAAQKENGFHENHGKKY